jgi:hypothetical protein
VDYNLQVQEPLMQVPVVEVLVELVVMLLLLHIQV